MRFPFVLLMSALSVGMALGQVSADTPAVVAARQRQEAVRSVKVAFAIREVREKGSATYLLNKTGATPPAPVPASQLVIESADNLLVIQGNSARLDLVHPLLHIETGKVDGTKVTMATNGTTNKAYYTPDSGPDRKSSGGKIEDATASSPLSGMELLPLKMTFRGEDRAFGPYPLTDFTPKGAALKIRGATCDEYVSAKGLVATAYLDPAKAYALTRFRVTSASGVLAEQINVEAVEAKGTLWVPSAWTYTRYDAAGKVTRTRTITVTNVELDTSYPPSHFDPQFPPGIEIVDTRSDERFLVRDDGSLLKLERSSQDDAATREDAKSSWWWRNKWFLAAGVVVLVALFLVRSWRRRVKARPAVAR